MKKFFAFIFLVIFLLFPKQSFAVSEFKTDYNVNYDVGSDGITSVTEKITLTNLTETYFASNFVLTIGSTALSEVSASDGGGNMEAKVDVLDNKTNISLKFNEQITGINKKQNFVLKYKSKDFASSMGKIWEVNLPRIHEGVDVNNFNLSLSVPFSFGEPISITPKPKSESDGAGTLTFSYTKEQLSNSGVSVYFGSNQVFDYNLKYNLNNTSFFPVVSSISLPMDTNYQDVSISSITPEPLNVTIDTDGNYLAWYQVQKRSSLQILVKGSAKLFINPKNNSFKLSKTQLSSLIKSDKFWEKDSPSIKAVISESFKNKQPKTTKEKVELLYQYVVSTLKYNPNKLPDQTRLGALTVLSNTEKAQSQEFTDLFITLVREAGIPARELDGIGYSQNEKLRPMIHTWAEYYDETYGWVMVDPTWENTSGGVDYFNKLDLNHFVLNIRGNSSLEPQPITDISVNISDAEFKPVVKPEVEINVSENLWSGLPGAIKLKITNKGSVWIDSENLNISANAINILDSKNISISSIPPFGFTSFEVNFRAPLLAESISDEIAIDYMEQKFTKQVKINPFFLIQLFPYLFIFIIVLVLGMYGLVLGIHTYKRRKSSK